MSTIIDIAIPAYNAADTIAKTVNAFAAQAMPDGWELAIYVADDCSSDDTASIAKAAAPELVTIVQLGTNRGRSAARNAAARSGHGEWILFCDADCLPENDRVVANLINYLIAEPDAVVGQIRSDTPGFWGAYTNHVAAERARATSEGKFWELTTAVFTITRALFTELAGYDEAYAHYGFEDRDLLLRLREREANVRSALNVIVTHDEQNTVANVSAKMRASGRHSAPLFRQRHPLYYRASGYYRCDAERFGVASGVILPLALLARALVVPFAELLVKVSANPRGIAGLAIKVASCLAYFVGTAESKGR